MHTISIWHSVVGSWYIRVPAQKHVNEDALQPWLERSVCSDEVVHWKEFYCEGFRFGVSDHSTNRLQLVVAAVGRTKDFAIECQYTSMWLILQRASSPQEA